jgi:hypothetical protein
LKVEQNARLKRRRIGEKTPSGFGRNADTLGARSRFPTGGCVLRFLCLSRIVISLRNKKFVDDLHSGRKRNASSKTHELVHGGNSR